MLVRRLPAARPARRGFTLVELLAVMAILMVLVGIGAVALTRNLEVAKEREAYIKMGKIENAAKQYAAENDGTWPPSIMDLVQPANGNPPILEGGLEAISDPWKNQFQMSIQRDEAGAERVVITTTTKNGKQLTWPKQ